MKRLWMAACLLATTGCGGEPAREEGPSGLPDVVATVPNNSADAPAKPTALTIACAPPGERELRAACAVDRLSDAGGTVLTIRLPDGGFRRLRVSDNGREVTAADGSEPASVRRTGEGIDVTIGDARFRLPARVGADAPG